MRKVQFKQIYSKLTKWFSFIWERKHLRGPTYWYPDSNSQGTEIGKRIARLLIDYTRMDLEDGKADSLARLESWLVSEMQRMEARSSNGSV